MPVPKILKSFASKNTLKAGRNTTTAPNVSVDHKKDASSKTLVMAAVVPTYPDNLTEAWAVAHKELPKAKGVEKFLNRVESVQNTLTLSPGEEAVVDTLAAPVRALLDPPQVADAIQKGVNTFMEAVPSLMKALDEVAKVHPFISVAVLAFKAVYTLEVKRRENDRRILALYTEMKDMMAVLVQLKDVTDATKVAPDGQTIEGRMQKLCTGVAEDIKKCANTCDTYLKKKILVKIFAGPIWEGRLVDFVATFTKRRNEFEFALTIHTAVGVDEANLKLVTVDERTAELNQKMEVMLQMFQTLLTPEQKKLVDLVEKNGGNAVLDNEDAMKQLAAIEASLSPASGRHGSGRFDLAEIQHEIRDDPTDAIEKNAEFFNRKFDMQRRQIEEDIARAVRREGDRIITAVLAGPHDRIVDPDLYQIWKDMGWRGNVKARHFVMALKDYYIEKAAGESAGSLVGADKWALKYISVNRARTILEAFDDDASGFVTIQEVNSFTRARPLDWSLPHWLAYWAIGWQMTCTSYCEKIEEIFDAIINLADEVLPENRKEVNDYIRYVWNHVTVWVRSIKREKGTEELREKFESHVTAEEARLHRNLEDIMYDIDSYDTVKLVAGNGRPETSLFVMLYLALKRDLERISLARKHVLSHFELYDAVETILFIIDAAWYRLADLRAIYEQQNLDAKEQFKVFAKGMYQIGHESGSDFHGDQLRELPDPIPARDEVVPDPDSVPLTILNHPLGTKHEIDFGAYDAQVLVPPSGEGSDLMLGTWYGFMYMANGKPANPMITLILTRGEGENSLAASGTHYRAGYHKTFTVTGKSGTPQEDGKIPMDLKFVYVAIWLDAELTGTFDPEEKSLRGTVKLGSGATSGNFVFKRDPDFVRFYPSPSSIGTSARKRWEFATTAVLDRIRRDSWSPTYILQRIKDGKRYMELSLRDDYYGRELDAEEEEEFYKLFSSLLAGDARFYAALITIKLAAVPIHPIVCDICDSVLGGARVLCMDCHDKTTVDLCSEPECLKSTVTLKKRKGLTAPHNPNHSMLKVHRILFNRDTGRAEKNAKEALEAARVILSDLMAQKEPMPQCIHCKENVSQPCWYCVDCTKERFICDDCEYKCLAFNDVHTKKHILVRVVEKVVEKVVSTEDRLQAVEGRLKKMEALLSRLLEKGSESSLDEALAKPDIQAAVEELKNPESDNQEANSNNQESTDK